MMGSISGYSRSVQIMSLPKSSEKTNCRNGEPLPQHGSFSPDSTKGMRDELPEHEANQHFGSFRGMSQRTLSVVDLVDQPRDDVAILNVEIVMWTIDVGGNDASELTPVLLVIGSVIGSE
jgi:hypothetical protein